MASTPSGAQPHPPLGSFCGAGALMWFALAFGLFAVSPVYQLTDSRFVFLLSESLMYRGAFELTPMIESSQRVTPELGHFIARVPYQLEKLPDGRIFHYWPPGAAILSIPYVWVANQLGYRTFDLESGYDPDMERVMQLPLAWGLSALFVACVWISATWAGMRRGRWWICAAVTAATPVWSIASRSLWSNTWVLLLLGTAILLLQLLEAGRGRGILIGAALATVLSWGYFIRPTTAVPIVCVGVFLAIRNWRALAGYAVVGLLWLGLFLWYSHANFGQAFPSYSKGSRLSLAIFPIGLAGNMISPSRGMLVYTPGILAALYLAARRWKVLRREPLAILALAAASLQLAAISCFPVWWAGHSYGSRLTLELLPWFVLLAILAVRAGGAMLSRGEVIACILVTALGVIPNGLGALHTRCWLWNYFPEDVEVRPTRSFDWRYPQFLSPLLRPPPPDTFPPLPSGGRISPTDEGQRPLLWEGWTQLPTPPIRWTEGPRASVRFGIDQVPPAATLSVRAGAFVHPPALAKQSIRVLLNGVVIGSGEFTQRGLVDLEFPIPDGVLAKDNFLLIETPDAASPKSVGLNDDARKLGIEVEWITITMGTPIS